MEEHISAEQLDGFRSRGLSPGELVAADKHLAECPHCRDRLNERQQLQSSFTSLRKNLASAARAKPEHLSYELMERYVNGTADDLDRELVQGHLEQCSRCTRELEDLRDF